MRKSNADALVYSCRTCLGLGPSKKVRTSLSYFINTDHNASHVRYIDLLVQLVPQMKSTVSHTDRICAHCRKLLKLANTFIIQCEDVEVELQHTTNNEENLPETDRENDIPEIDSEVDISEINGEVHLSEESCVAKYMPELDGDEETEEVGIQENIEIIFEDDLTAQLADCSPPQFEVKKAIKFESEPVCKPEPNPQTEYAYICEKCGKSFKYRTSLRLHLFVHQDQKIKCPDCPKVFKSKMHLDNHQRIHMKDRSCQCTECGGLFSSRASLLHHTKLKHVNFPKYTCKICSRNFGRHDYLTRHLKRHTPWQNAHAKFPHQRRYKDLRDQVPDEMLPCKICGKSYKGFDKLKMHLKRHALVKRFGCRYCPMTYKLYSTLKKHELWHQQEDGIFLRCNVCWRRFTEEADLTNHMATRHANPRYECSYCEEKFHRKYLIDNHILLEHATPEEVELSHKTVVYDTLVELAEQAST